jgi:hypothetical protein
VNAPVAAVRVPSYANVQTDLEVAADEPCGHRNFIHLAFVPDPEEGILDALDRELSQSEDFEHGDEV